jgi:hypothetical protein
MWVAARLEREPPMMTTHFSDRRETILLEVLHMDLGRSFSYPFEDPDWLKKIGLVALVSLIPLLGQLIGLGWSLEVTRRVIRQDPRPLPDLDFGSNLVDGLKIFVVVFAYLIPVWILLIPMTVVPFTLGDQGGGAEAIIGFVAICGTLLIILYSFLIAFLLPAAYGILAATGSIGAALRVGDVFGMVRTAPGAYLMVLLGTIVTGIIAQLGAVACLIGVFVTFAYSMAVNGHLYGQAYNEVNTNRGFARAY